MEDKRKDIRFITSGYDGEVKTLKCRHIDEAHIRLVGKYSGDYHICKLAEKMSGMAANVSLSPAKSLCSKLLPPNTARHCKT